MKRCIALIAVFVLALTPVGPGAAVYAAPAISYPATEQAEQFINYIWRTYGITLEDANGYLSGEDGADMMQELESCLTRFSAGFINKMVGLYAGYNASVSIILSEPSKEESGYVEWNGDLDIYLHYDSDPDYNGISDYVLAHELGHAVHFIIETFIGEQQCKDDMVLLNEERYQYAGDSFSEVWTQAHGAAFAYNYGMHDYCEDIATLFELLVGDREGMRKRLKNPANYILRRKVEYIQAIAYEYISNECYAVFEPLASTEELPLGIVFPVDVTSSRLYVDREPAEAQAYLINGNNYFKLRDIAMLLNGTDKSFDLVYAPISRTVTLIPGRGYTAAGGELANDGPSVANAAPTTVTVYLNGRLLNITAYVINGYNYVKLRDICDALGVLVRFEAGDIKLYTRLMSQTAA